MSDVASVVLWLFVMNLGLVFGAGLYEHRIGIPRWLREGPAGRERWDAQAARADDVGRRFWAFASTLPLTLLTLASLYLASSAAGPPAAWWRAAALVSLAERLVTFSYFIPVMVRLMKAPDSREAAVRARRWSRLNHARHGLVLAAWLASLRALAAAS